MTKQARNRGSSFDQFLEDEGLLGEVTAQALKKVIALQLAEAMKRRELSKLEVAKRMGTSRSHLGRVLDATDTGLTLETLSKAARAVGCGVRIELISTEAQK